MKKIDPKYKFTAAVVLFLSFVAFLVRLILFPGISLIQEVKVYSVSLFVFSIVAVIFFLINNGLNKLYPFERSVIGRIIIQITIGLIFIFTARYFLVTVGLKRAPIEIQVTKVFMVAIFLVDFFVCLSINFAFFAEHFFNQWRKSIERAERLEKEKALVQYDNLKNQLNPHFLFNSLTSLNTLIHENQDQASRFLKQLSKVYRYLLENNELVSLKKETEFFENYASLVKTRFGNALKIVIEIPEASNDYNIVPVTLQSLLENALKHNVLTPDRPLTIRIVVDDEYLIVENNLQRKSIVENSNKQGLNNLKNFYRFLSPKEITVEEEGGKFKVKVPLIS